jgi:hypothetical protein
MEVYFQTSVIPSTYNMRLPAYGFQNEFVMRDKGKL